MSPVIDLGSELLVDASRVWDPYVRLLVASVGETLASDSPWLAIDKRVAVDSGLVWGAAAGGPTRAVAYDNLRATVPSLGVQLRHRRRSLSPYTAQ